MKSFIQIGIILLVILFVFSSIAAFAVTDKPTVANMNNATKNMTNATKTLNNATKPNNATNATMSGGKKNVTEPMNLPGGIVIAFVIALGLLAFGIVIILQLYYSKWDPSKLNGGEIRKAITIAFTIIYLIMLPCYFFYAYLPASVNASSVHNTTKESLQTFNVSSDAVPLLATSDFMSNFFYLYILIISFYFGSRYFEDRRKANDLMEINRSQMELLRKRAIDKPNSIDDTTLFNRIDEIKNKI